MSLNLKNPETARLIRELAAETGESMTEAVTIAVRERLDRIRARDPDRSERVWAIVREIRSRLPEGYLDQDLDDLLYDAATGLPR
jgi:antitoxin VapB